MYLYYLFFLSGIVRDSFPQSPTEANPGVNLPPEDLVGSRGRLTVGKPVAPLALDHRLGPVNSRGSEGVVHQRPNGKFPIIFASVTTTTTTSSSGSGLSPRLSRSIVDKCENSAWNCHKERLREALKGGEQVKLPQRGQRGGGEGDSPLTPDLLPYLPHKVTGQRLPPKRHHMQGRGCVTVTLYKEKKKKKNDEEEIRWCCSGN